MKRSPLIWIVGVAAVLLLLGGVFLLSRPGGGALPGSREAVMKRVLKQAGGAEGDDAGDPIANAPKQVPANAVKPPADSALPKYIEKIAAAQSPEQLRKFIAANGETAENLVLAVTMTGDREFLDRALALHPNDPKVQLAVALGDYNKQERLAAAEALRKLAPDNALGDILVADLKFKAGDTEAALADLQSAIRKGQLDDYEAQLTESAEKALAFGGLDASEAKWGSQNVTQSAVRLNKVLNLSKSLAELYTAQMDAGQPEAAAATMTTGVQLAHLSASSSDSLVEELMSVSAEARMLKDLPEDLMVPDTDRTVAQRRQELDQIKGELSQLSKGYQERVFGLNPGTMTRFTQLRGQDGEAAAIQWLISQNTAPKTP
jgi:hypothetical protein